MVRNGWAHLLRQPSERKIKQKLLWGSKTTFMADSDIIEINGKRYDGRTGHPLSIPKHSSKPPAKVKKIPVQLQTSSQTVTPIRHRTERAQTLMRQAVKKPAPAETAKSPKIHHHPAKAQLAPDPERVQRAQQIPKHQAVSRFGAPASPSRVEQEIKPIITALPVKPEPTLSPQEIKQLLAEDTDHSTRHQFQQAIDRAQSHTEPRPQRVTRRHRLSRKIGVGVHVVNFGAVALAAILLIGFIAYQNIPNFSMHMAARRAGVAAQLPGYQPSGFGLSGPIEYQPGQITLNFRSHSDNRQFQIFERNSTWDDVSLLKEYLAPDHDSFQVRQSNGKTIYLYDGHSATWVQGGVWYQIVGKSALSSDQLVRVATSL